MGSPAPVGGPTAGERDGLLGATPSASGHGTAHGSIEDGEMQSPYKLAGQTPSWRGAAKCLMYTTYLLVLVALPICIWQLKENEVEDHIVAWFTGAVFCFLAVPLSVYDIVQHMLHFNRPVLQTYVIRIMWMVPIYAVESWLALRFKQQAIYLETAREAYEAYVIYCFYMFLVHYLGDEQTMIRALKGKDPHHLAHVPPFKWFLRQWEGGAEFFNKCKFGTLQYVVVKLVCAAVTFVAQAYDVYGEGDAFNFGHVYAYVTFFSNVSQVWAMYCLVLFYHGHIEELRPIKPLPKFVCIKSVVFFSFWQAVGIAFLVHQGAIHGTLTYTTNEVAAGLQDFLICIEMFLAAVAHHYAFSYSDFPATGSEGATRGFVEAFIESSMPTDVYHDVRSQFAGKGTQEYVATGDGDNYTSRYSAATGAASDSGREDAVAPHSARETSGGGLARSAFA